MSGGLPPGWAARPIPAGLWLYEEPAPAAARAAELEWLARDPARPVVVAEGRGQPALDAVAAALQGGERRVRLMLPGVPPRMAQRFAERHSLDLVATSGLLRIHRTQAVTWGFDDARPDAFWQWFRYVPGRRPEPFGAVYPSPGWEASLLDGRAVPARLAGMAVHRIPAGLALHANGPPGGAFPRQAAAVQPDPERLSVVVDPAIPSPDVPAALRHLLGVLLPGTARLRLVRSGAARIPGLLELCARHGAEILAPDAELVQEPRTGALLTAGPYGPGRWVRLTARGEESLGALRPEPYWRPLVHGVLRSDVVEAPAGLRLRRPYGSWAGRLAAALPPDGERLTVLADGDPGRAADREALEDLIERLPGPLRASFRLVMADAATGGPRAYGQWLANRFGSVVSVASGVPAIAWERTAPRLPAPAVGWLDFHPEDRPAFPPDRFAATSRAA